MLSQALQFEVTIILLFKISGTSRVSVGESSRPSIKGAGVEQELICRRQASSIRSQNGNMDDIIVTVNGKCFMSYLMP